MVWQFLFFSYDNWVSSTIISRTVNLDNVGEKKDLMLYEVIIIIIITTMSYMPITQPFCNIACNFLQCINFLEASKIL
jgi:hypothetical protein